MRSMTGYGRASLERDGRELTLELKTVNHRFLDLNIRLPRALLFLEDGKIAEEAAPEDFFTAPKTERAKKFLKTFEFDEVKPHRD